MEKNEYSSSAEIMESIRRKQPEPILLGAILSQGNRLQTTRGRFYDLMREMQAGNFSYPESIQPIIDDVSFRDQEQNSEIESGQYPVSEQIESMFVRLSTSKKIDFDKDEFGNESFQMPDITIYDFLEKYADDYDVLEFFERCGDYLSATATDTIE